MAKKNFNKQPLSRYFKGQLTIFSEGKTVAQVSKETGVSPATIHKLKRGEPVSEYIHIKLKAAMKNPINTDTTLHDQFIKQAGEMSDYELAAAVGVSRTSIRNIKKLEPIGEVLRAKITKWLDEQTVTETIVTGLAPKPRGLLTRLDILEEEVADLKIKLAHLTNLLI